MTHEPANRAEVIAVLRKRLNLTEDVSSRSYEGFVQPGYGLSRDCRFDMAGFACRDGRPLGGTPEPGKYLELGYFERAMTSLSH